MLCINLTQQKNRDVLNPVCRHKRADYGLPEDKFIFACFNQLYKMDPDIFNTWYFHASNSFFYHMLCFLLTVSLNRCNILKRVPNSALWLLRFPAAGETRLRAYAAAQGVKPDQIIFTDVAVKNEHIRRSALADLFLDTSITIDYNIIIYLFFLISLKEYEERAVALAENPSKLQALTNRLKAVRMTCPLFDTKRWVS
ncbi:hypothetical protein BHE74_00009187 [Ensete ventricosum]|nr:hypothetical protein GW17_00021931 [Ensete ventricosum]RWW82355.1 hypothetical protein BHE74_00009187 [Ensete ventricosum]